MSSSKVAKILDEIEAKLAEIEDLVKKLREEEEMWTELRGGEKARVIQKRT